MVTSGYEIVRILGMYAGNCLLVSKSCVGFRQAGELVRTVSTTSHCSECLSKVYCCHSLHNIESEENDIELLKSIFNDPQRFR